MAPAPTPPPEEMQAAVTFLDWLTKWGAALVATVTTTIIALVGIGWRGGRGHAKFREDLAALRHELDEAKTQLVGIQAWRNAATEAWADKPSRREVRDWIELLREDVRAIGRQPRG